ncbi:helix-turn-helix domain-containing protein [Nocardia noduli]|uniref:helix-turn-helix domain-containing protein n=1 Tax=Nocardia noduli TaxID=2815722 RepID=UPI001C22D78B|nr:helix-turn-helix domain-containing protein [Nocardia noduli]
MNASTQSAEVPTGLINLKTAASLIDVDVKTLKNWIKAGRIRGFRINGRLWRVQRDELLGLVQVALDIETAGVE